MDFKVKKLVTIPLLKIVVDRPINVFVVSPIHKGKEQKNTKDGVSMEPADLLHCINLETFAPCQIIVGAVLGSSLRENYPEASYVGKAFRIVQSKVENKRYKAYDVVELEIDDDEALRRIEEGARLLMT